MSGGAASGDLQRLELVAAGITGVAQRRGHRAADVPTLRGMAAATAFEHHAIPFVVPTLSLAAEPYFNYADLADLSFYMRMFNMVVIAFIFKSAIASLVRAANVKLLYVPAGVCTPVAGAVFACPCIL